MSETRIPNAAGTRFVQVATLDGLRPGEFRRIAVEGHVLVLARDGAAVYAFQSTCPHEMADLAQGRIDDGCLICPRHLATFRLSDGAVSTGWKNVAPLKLYPVRIDGNEITVDAAAVARNPPAGKRQVWDLSR